MKAPTATLLAVGTAWLASAPDGLAQGGGTSGGGPPALFDTAEAVAPALQAYTDSLLRDDLWRRTDLSLRDRSIVTVAALVAGGHADALPPYLHRALDSGVKPAALGEAITHPAFYTGWPHPLSAASPAKGVFAQRGVATDQLVAAGDPLPGNEEAERERAAYVARNRDGVAPALRDYTNAVLFDDVWRRPGLSPRDRSLVTISALIAGGKAAQLVGHLNRGLDNGLTRAEVAATITHLAFYAGWPNAMSAAAVAREVFGKRPD